MDPLSALGLAASVAQFIDFGASVVKLAHQLNSAEANRNSIAAFIERIEGLNTICSTLQTKCGSYEQNEAERFAEEGLIGLAVQCREDAEIANKFFQTLVPTIERENQRVTSLTPHSKGKSSKNVLGESGKELKKAQEYMRKVRAAFLMIWNKAEIEDVVGRLAWYRDELNLRTLALVNIKTDHLLIKTDELHVQNESLLSKSDQQAHDVVEVLSINRSIQSTLESVAAILTRRDGEKFTISSQGLRMGNSSAMGKDSSITYSLEGSAELSNQGVEMVQHNASDFPRKIVNALYFREEGGRHETIAEAHRNTFKWIFQPHSIEPSSNDFGEWLANGEGCYWINGKAGSGKSTLMKYIKQEPKTQQNLVKWAGHCDLIIASFFFWHAGTSLQKSYEGLLRSLLLQILDRRQDLVPILFPSLSRFLISARPTEELQISFDELQAAFFILMKQLPKNLKIWLLIDGIDEYTGNHRDMSKLLLHLAETPGIKVLVSSRPIPACFQVFSPCPGLRVQDLTEGDIKKYVEDELLSDHLMKEMNIREEGFADEITKTLINKAFGVFLWIILVVKDLLEGLGNHDRKKDLLNRVEKLPSDLEKLYRHMFDSMSDEYQREASLLLQLVMRSTEVQSESLMTVLQLSFAEEEQPQKAVDVYVETLSPTKEALRIKDMEGRMRSRCCGLIESQRFPRASLRRSREPRVGFLHKTVIDFLRETSVWKQLISLEPKTQLEIDEILLASCVEVMRRKLPIGNDVEKSHIAENLSCCLRYSSEIAKRDDDKYVAYLESGWETMIQYCRSISLTISEHDSYNERFERWARSELSALTFRHYTEKPPQASIMLILLSRVPHFLERRTMQTWGTAEDASLMLVNILLEMEFYDGSDRGIARDVKIILEHGSKPNTVVKVEDQFLFSSQEENVRLARELSNTDDGDFIPWNYWLIVLSHAVYSVPLEWHRVALYMMQAGAELNSQLPKKRKALQEFAEDIERRWTDCFDPEKRETLGLIRNLLLEAKDKKEAEGDKTAVEGAKHGRLSRLFYLRKPRHRP